MTDEFKRARDEAAEAYLKKKGLNPERVYPGGVFDGFKAGADWAQARTAGGIARLKMRLAHAMDLYAAWREQAEKLVDALERLHELSLQGTNPVSIEASRIANEALRAYEARREGE